MSGGLTFALSGFLPASRAQPLPLPQEVPALIQLDFHLLVPVHFLVAQVALRIEPFFLLGVLLDVVVDLYVSHDISLLYSVQWFGCVQVRQTNIRIIQNS